MKKVIILIIVIAIIAALAVVEIRIFNQANDVTEIENQNESAEKEIVESETTNKKVAVIYFSVTGNTKQIAEYIKEEMNCDIIEIVPKEKYKDEDLNWNDNTTRATIEQNDKSARPEMASEIDVAEYDTIFLGYPIWWGDTPRIIQTFIESVDLGNKTIIPFCTSGSSPITESEKTLHSYKTIINWIEGKRFSSSSTKDEVANWIDSLNIE